MKDDLTKYGEHPIEQLSNAIVIQAVDDLADALFQKHEAEESLRAAQSMITDCETFFAGDWYAALSSVDPATLQEVAKQQADYMIWQKKTGCSGKCKFTDCPHRAKKAHWYAWTKGDKTCLKRESEKKKERRRAR